MNIVKNECYEIEITSVTSEGNGVGKIDGFALFVPETAIGDIVLVKVLKVLKSYGFGKVVSLLKPSANRIKEDCACYTQCGGCSYRHISYDAELSLKEDLVVNAFQRLGNVDVACTNIIGSERINSYRNKAQYPVGKDKDGNIISGFYAKRSHRIINSSFCKLQAEEFEQIKNTIIDFFNKSNISIYDEQKHTGLIRHIYIRKAEATNEVMVCLVATKPNIPKMDTLIDSLNSNFANIKSVIINVNAKQTNVILGDHCVTVYGTSYITDVICGIKIKISPLAFYQVNKLQAEVLYQTAINYAELSKDDVLIDLYCGTGTIGLIAAHKVKQVIGIEIIPQAIENAKENAKINGIDNARFICADAKKATKQLLTEGVVPDVVIVDPPRKGLDQEVIDAIVQMCPRKIVMVSCNPATAARDTSLLEQNGYKAKILTPVDMFPRTTHVETTIMMTRCGFESKK
ncbi:23S rRNA (uracil(1939)-C(5))-methyltransferase RlmD [Paludicola sp. MB14-C6]|uniref:23S rRNA (uracil(1939)-C(5))-methyltransferase RlmD n=1 Tax=Paludihabitans sp. MB14-C6 TaxID=3070656 RepID=UPI0027DB0FEC|nr:23S rRNA (uracil(1939)-C(5))-methyltransferase RlmD [Paludicola sp. MB14-C6]WMJ23133.1 23S rRNA (uracil(1939)-C(5))-methyltransferase RlmD [Paludicola sp. MB14-C6]